MRYDENSHMISGGRTANIFLIIGIIGLALSGIGYFSDQAQFFHSYLVAFFFWASISLGALFFTMLHHMVDAKWSIVVRRINENIMMTIPVMALFAIPLFFGIHDLYHWSHADVVANDVLLQGKAAYLNSTFFIIRIVIFFLIWTALAYALYNYSIKQDTDFDQTKIKTVRRISGGGLLFFAVSITLLSFDLLMSLDAHWYSTIFGVYIFSGAFLGLLSLLDFTVMQYNSKGILSKIITSEHYHDIGKLMFAFTIFWGYMAFSQYFLIWYGNIPEETIWFLERWEGSWSTVTLIILFGHFMVPFFGLFPMFVKRNRTYMRIMASWILLMHFVDLYWIVMPNLHHHGVHLSWLDLTTFVGIGGVFLFVFIKKMHAKPMIPVGDPGLKESMKFVNF